MKPHLFRACLLAVAFAVRCGAQAHEEKAAIVAPLSGEEILQPCTYRLVLPKAKARAIWTIFDRGRDDLNWFRDVEVRAFAERHRLALVLAAHCRSVEREDMIVEPTKGVGRALFTAFDQFAQSENRPELRTVPMIAMGWSGAGSLTARLAGYRPSRYLAGVAYAPGQYEPLGMDTIELSRDAIRAPQLIIANGADKINGTERPYNYFRRYLDEGAPWTFVVQNRTPHCCLQNAQALILEWLRAILTTKTKDWGRGTYGFIVPEPSAVRDEWQRPVFNASAARTASKDAKLASDELPAGWMPSRSFTAEWLRFVRRS